jgi:hypothetical protein
MMPPVTCEGTAGLVAAAQFSHRELKRAAVARARRVLDYGSSRRRAAVIAATLMAACNHLGKGSA